MNREHHKPSFVVVVDNAVIEACGKINGTFYFFNKLKTLAYMAYMKNAQTFVFAEKMVDKSVHRWYTVYIEYIQYTAWR